MDGDASLSGATSPTKTDADLPRSVAQTLERSLPPPLRGAFVGGERIRLTKTQQFADGVSVREGEVGFLMNTSSQAACWAVIFPGSAGGSDPHVVPESLLEPMGRPSLVPASTAAPSSTGVATTAWPSDPLTRSPEFAPSAVQPALASTAPMGDDQGNDWRAVGSAFVGTLGVLAGVGVLVLAFDPGLRARVRASLLYVPPRPAPSAQPRQTADDEPGPVIKVTAPSPAAPPALTFLELDPRAGKSVLLEDRVLKVRGKLSDASAGPLRIGEAGRPGLSKALEADGAFVALVPLDAGATVVEVRAGSGAREVVARIPVEVDAQAPDVTLEVPAIWEGGPVEVAAHIKAAHPRTVRKTLVLDGKAGEGVTSPLASAGDLQVHWAALAVVPRTMAVRVEVEDALGRTGRAEREVPFDRTPPTIAIESPTAGLETTDSVRLGATVATRAGVQGAQVAVNPDSADERVLDLPVDGDGKVNLLVPLPEGEGPVVLEVRARDRLGNSGTARVTVDRIPQGPKLPDRLRRGAWIKLADGKSVRVYLWTLPESAGDMELVRVSAGDFTMGSNDPPEAGRDVEMPQHKQAMPDDFFIGRNDVTWGQYLAFCAATGRTKPGRPAWATADDQPVVNVTWGDAQAYGAWAGLALPSEAEWEKAARGTDGRNWPWGNNWDGANCNHRIHSDDNGAGEVDDISDGSRHTSPVGAFPAGASPYGALDMAGNVSQWCEDWYGSAAWFARFERGRSSPPADGSYRVCRGGSFCGGASTCRSFERGKGEPSRGNVHLGFRVLVKPDALQRDR